jgi:hypothetical protein
MAELTINTETGEVVGPSLAEHEATIERGLKTFVEVGQALQAIRDERLYLEQYDRFEDYCKERWGWTRMRAQQLIDASVVADNIAGLVSDKKRLEADARHHASRARAAEQCVNQGLHLPQSERVARPLTKLPAEEQADAWEEVVTESETTGEKITAKKVESVVARRRDVGHRLTPHEPTKGHTSNINKRTALELSHNPVSAALTLVEFFDRDYLTRLVEAIHENL